MFYKHTFTGASALASQPCVVANSLIVKFLRSTMFPLNTELCPAGSVLTGPGPHGYAVQPVIGVPTPTADACMDGGEASDELLCVETLDDEDYIGRDEGEEESAHTPYSLNHCQESESSFESMGFGLRELFLLEDDLPYVGWVVSPQLLSPTADRHVPFCADSVVGQ